MLLEVYYEYHSKQTCVVHNVSLSYKGVGTNSPVFRYCVLYYSFDVITKTIDRLQNTTRVFYYKYEYLPQHIITCSLHS